MPPSPLRLRAARLPDEASALGAADFRAFREGAAEMWTAYFRDTPQLRHANGALVAETASGVIAGQCALLRFDLALTGVDVPAMGVAGVGVAPEFRRQGIADRLMREALRRIRRAGVPLALLYPFSVAFYRRFGYELCEWVDLLRVAPAQLPASPLRAHVRRLERAGGPGGLRSPGGPPRSAGPVDDEPEVRALYDRCRAAGATGPFARDDHWWTDRVFRRADEWFVYQDPRTRRLEGLLGYGVPSAPAYPYQLASVHDFWAATPDAYAGLVGALAAFGEQFARIELYLPRGQAMPLLVEHGRNDVEMETRAHIGAYSATCAMARLVDVAAAFAVHPGARRVRGKLGLDLEDPVFADQSRSFDVTFRGKSGVDVVPGRAARDRLALTIGRLSQAYFAAAPATQLVAQGLAQGAPAAARLLDAAFAGPPLHLGAANYF